MVTIFSNGNIGQTSRRGETPPNERHSNPDDEMTISNNCHASRDLGHSRKNSNDHDGKIPVWT